MQLTLTGHQTTVQRIEFGIDLWGQTNGYHYAWHLGLPYPTHQPFRCMISVYAEIRHDYSPRELVQIPVQLPRREPNHGVFAHRILPNKYSRGTPPEDIVFHRIDDCLGSVFQSSESNKRQGGKAQNHGRVRPCVIRGVRVSCNFCLRRCLREKKAIETDNLHSASCVGLYERSCSLRRHNNVGLNSNEREHSDVMFGNYPDAGQPDGRSTQRVEMIKLDTFPLGGWLKPSAALGESDATLHASLRFQGFPP